MAKKENRIVEAPESIIGMVDKGVDVDIEMKNLTFEDKACKQGITEFVEEKIGKKIYPQREDSIEKFVEWLNERAK